MELSKTHGLIPKRHPIPYVVHYFWPWPIEEKGAICDAYRDHSSPTALAETCRICSNLIMLLFTKTESEERQISTLRQRSCPYKGRKKKKDSLFQVSSSPIILFFLHFSVCSCLSGTTYTAFGWSNCGSRLALYEEFYMIEILVESDLPFLYHVPDHWGVKK